MTNQTLRNWQEVTLKDLGILNRGKSKFRPRNDPSLFDGDYPFIQTSDIKNTILHVTQYSDTYNEKGLSQSKLWNPGVLLITIAANIAETGILGIKACFPDSVVAFEGHKGIRDNIFVKYLFEILKLEFKNFSRGTTQDNLSLEKLKSLKFKVPDYSLRKIIASMLSIFDELIENNRRRIEILEEMAQLLYREWFVELRFPGHEKVKMVNSELGKIPEGWEVSEISQLLKLRSGYPFKSSTYVDDGKYRIVTISNIGDSKFDPQTNDRVSLVPNNMPDYCELTDGDILISLTGNIGRMCLVYGEDNFLLNQRVGKLEAKSLIYKSYGYCLFSSYYLKKYLENISNGAAQQNLSPVETVKIKIYIPKNTVLEDFHLVVNPMLEQIITLNNQNLVLANTRDLLLPKLINGELRV